MYLSPDLPDYVKWAEAMGCVGIRVEAPEEVQPAIDKANEIDDRPVVVEFRVDSREKVFPMVPAGMSNDDIVVAAPSQDKELLPMSERPKHHILSVLVENKSGVLARVASLFARRGYNIFSLAVAPTEDERFSRITIVVDVESAPLEQIVKQLFKLINVVKITELDPPTSVERELLLVTVRASPTDAGPDRRARADLRGQDPAVGPRAPSPSRSMAPRQARRLRGAAARLWHRGAPAHRPGRAAEVEREARLPRRRKGKAS